MKRTYFHTRRFGFTLVELIVVISVMTILASISGLAFRRIAADLRMSTAENTLSASLDNARSIAIQKNRYVMAVFIPRLTTDKTEQVTDIILAQWNGDSMNAISGRSIRKPASLNWSLKTAQCSRLKAKSSAVTILMKAHGSGHGTIPTSKKP